MPRTTGQCRVARWVLGCFRLRYCRWPRRGHCWLRLVTPVQPACGASRRKTVSFATYTQSTPV